MTAALETLKTIGANSSSSFRGKTINKFLQKKSLSHIHCCHLFKFTILWESTTETSKELSRISESLLSKLDCKFWIAPDDTK